MIDRIIMKLLKDNLFLLRKPKTKLTGKLFEKYKSNCCAKQYLHSLRLLGKFPTKNH